MIRGTVERRRPRRIQLFTEPSWLANLAGDFGLGESALVGDTMQSRWRGCSAARQFVSAFVASVRAKRAQSCGSSSPGIWSISA